MQWQSTARRQHGVITREQLSRCGLSDWQIRSLVTSGHLAPDRKLGRFRSQTVHPTALTEAWSAVLAARSVLSHLSAAAQWGMAVPQTGELHVIAPDRRRTVMPPGVVVHRVALADGEVIERDGLPTTTRSRTALDCLGILSAPIARTMFDRALQKQWMTVADVKRRLTVDRGRWGNGRLRALLAEAELGDAESERLLHEILRGAGIGGWRPNAQIPLPFGTITVDVLFAGSKLVIEVDGWAYHSDVDRFQADRTRQNALTAAGWTVLRFTWRDLVERPRYVVLSIRS